MFYYDLINNPLKSCLNYSILDQQMAIDFSTNNIYEKSSIHQVHFQRYEIFLLIKSLKIKCKIFPFVFSFFKFM